MEQANIQTLVRRRIACKSVTPLGTRSEKTTGEPESERKNGDIWTRCRKRVITITRGAALSALLRPAAEKFRARV